MTKLIQLLLFFFALFLITAAFGAFGPFGGILMIIICIGTYNIIAGGDEW